MKGEAQEKEQLSFMLRQCLVHLEDTHTKKEGSRSHIWIQ